MGGSQWPIALAQRDDLPAGPLGGLQVSARSSLQRTGYLIMIGRAFALLLLLVATGCVTMGMGNVEKLRPEHRTLVVSVLGDNFQVESIGTTIFQVWRKTEDVSN